MRQIWLRHKNGGGKVFGNDAEVSTDTYLDRQSAVGDNADIDDARLYNSNVFDDALVSRASVWNSTIGDKTLITGGDKGAVVVNCELSGSTRIRGNPTLYDVSLRDVWVFGDAVLEGYWDLSVPVRIHRGTWTRPPRYKIITAENINVVLSECADDHFHLACWCLPRTTWFRPGYRQRLGAHAGWTPQQVQFAFDTFSAWAG